MKNLTIRLQLRLIIGALVLLLAVLIVAAQFNMGAMRAAANAAGSAATKPPAGPAPRLGASQTAAAPADDKDQWASF